MENRPTQQQLTNIFDEDAIYEDFQESNFGSSQIPDSFTLNKDYNNQIGNNNISSRKRFPFSKEEDDLLLKLVRYYDINNKNAWQIISCHMKGRNARQCRERYQLFLSESIQKKGKWTKEEDELLLYKYAEFGPHWKKMEPFFNGRTSYNIKNRFKSFKRPKHFINSYQNCNLMDSKYSLLPNNNISSTMSPNSNNEPHKNNSHNSNLQILSSFSFSCDEGKKEESLETDTDINDNCYNNLLDCFEQPELINYFENDSPF